MSQLTKKFDLEERTAKFGEAVIDFCRVIEQNPINKSIISQLIRSSTSIGANYMEANGASSKKDFKNKIHLCQKEARETKHWLRMLSKCEPAVVDGIRKLWREAQELTLIFGKILSTLNRN